MLAGLAAVMVVAGGVYYYFNDVDVPPTLSFGGAGVQGMLEDGEQGFLEYEDGDEADYKDFISGYKDDNVDAEVMRLHSGVNNVYVPEEISVEDLSKCIDPEAGRVLFAQWDAKEGSFMVYPEGPFAETTTVDTDYKFKKGSGLVVISRHSADSWCLAAADTKSSVAVVAPMAADQDGWVLLPSNNGKVADFIEPFNDRVLKVWKMVGDNEFERVREDDYDQDLGDYYLLWLKLEKAQEVAVDDNHYVPTGVEADYSKEGNNSQIILTWDRAAASEQVVDYLVKVYKCVGDLCDHTGYFAEPHEVNGERFVVSNPEPGSKYYFKVAAEVAGRAVVDDDYSAEVSKEVPVVEVGADPAGGNGGQAVDPNGGAPAASLAPQHVAGHMDGEKLVISWDKVADTPEKVVNKYSVSYYNSDLDGFSNISAINTVDVGKNLSSIRLASTQLGKHYTFAVIAQIIKVDDRSVELAKSDSATFDTPAAPVVEGEVAPAPVVYNGIGPLRHELVNDGNSIKFSWPKVTSPRPGETVSYLVSARKTGDDAWPPDAAAQPDYTVDRDSVYSIVGAAGFKGVAFKVKVVYHSGREVVGESAWSNVDTWYEGIGELTHAEAKLADGRDVIRYCWSGIVPVNDEHFTYDFSWSVDDAPWSQRNVVAVSDWVCADVMKGDAFVIYARVRSKVNLNGVPGAWSSVDKWLGAGIADVSHQASGGSEKFSWLKFESASCDNVSYDASWINNPNFDRGDIWTSHNDIAQPGGDLVFVDVPIQDNFSVQFRVKVKCTIGQRIEESEFTYDTWYAGVDHLDVTINGRDMDFNWAGVLPVNGGTVSYVIALSEDGSHWSYYPPTSGAFTLVNGFVHFHYDHAAGVPIYAKVMAVYHIGGHNYDSAYSDILQAGN